MRRRLFKTQEHGRSGDRRGEADGQGLAFGLSKGKSDLGDEPDEGRALEGVDAVHGFCDQGIVIGDRPQMGE